MKRRTLEDIEIEIQVIREQMFKAASEYGYTHERTVQKSQNLDKLINEYLLYNCKQTDISWKEYDKVPFFRRFFQSFSSKTLKKVTYINYQAAKSLLATLL